MATGAAVSSEGSLAPGQGHEFAEVSGYPEGPSLPPKLKRKDHCIPTWFNDNDSELIESEVHFDRVPAAHRLTSLFAGDPCGHGADEPKGFLIESR